MTRKFITNPERCPDHNTPVVNGRCVLKYCTFNSREVREAE